MNVCAECGELLPDNTDILCALCSFKLPLHKTEAGYPRCATCDGGGCMDCTDPA